MMNTEKMDTILRNETSSTLKKVSEVYFKTYIIKSKHTDNNFKKLFKFFFKNLFLVKTLLES